MLEALGEGELILADGFQECLGFKSWGREGILSPHLPDTPWVSQGFLSAKLTLVSTV